MYDTGTAVHFFLVFPAIMSKFRQYIHDTDNTRCNELSRTARLLSALLLVPSMMRLQPTAVWSPPVHYATCFSHLQIHSSLILHTESYGVYCYYCWYIDYICSSNSSTGNTYLTAIYIPGMYACTLQYLYSATNTTKLMSVLLICSEGKNTCIILLRDGKRGTQFLDWSIPPSFGKDRKPCGRNTLD